MTRRMLASHPDWAEINQHQMLLVILLNPQMFFDLNGRVDVPVVERSVLADKINTVQGELLDGGLFRDFIEINLGSADDEKN